MSNADHPFHPAANEYPLMSEAALAELAEDILANGVRLPIWRFRGLIIDGRNRYLACKSLGIDPPAKEYPGTEEGLVAFIESLNEHRRHLTPEWLAQRREERRHRVLQLRLEGKSTRDIAKEVGASHETVRKDLGAVGDVLPEVIVGRDGSHYMAGRRPPDDSPPTLQGREPPRDPVCRRPPVTEEVTHVRRGPQGTILVGIGGDEFCLSERTALALWKGLGKFLNVEGTL